MLADVGVHPEQLLQNNDGGSRHGFRSCDIGGKRAVMSVYGDVIVHCVLLRRRSSGPPPMSSSGSAEAHYRARPVQRAACMAAAEVAASSMSLAVSFGRDM